MDVVDIARSQIEATPARVAFAELLIERFVSGGEMTYLEWNFVRFRHDLPAATLATMLHQLAGYSDADLERERQVTLI